MPSGPGCSRYAAPGCRWVGLTATAYRRDGLGPVIFMHCGPKRHTIPIIDKTDPEALQRNLYVHPTVFALPDDADTTKPGAITSVVFGGLVADGTRNDQVCHNVHDALWRARNCLVLTRQTAHVEALAARLRELAHEPHLLYATRKAKELKQVLAFLADPPAAGPPLLVVATDKYVGEGYDCPRLDTLFLAHPVSFKGSMVQYVGRILRNHPGKTTVGDPRLRRLGRGCVGRRVAQAVPLLRPARFHRHRLQRSPRALARTKRE
jgi:superfamily II DNA or RNA helicase